MLHELIGLLASHHGDRATTDRQSLETDLFGPMPWGIAFVAERAGLVVGYALLVRLYRAQYAQRVADLQHLFVRPDARGSGIGQALVRAAIADAERMGCSQIRVGTTAANQGAQDFYLGLGFGPVEASSGPRFKLRLPRPQGRAS